MTEEQTSNGVGAHDMGMNEAGTSGSARDIAIIPLTSADEPPRKVNLQDKVALIVGGASANGQSLAVAFAERDMDVVIVYFNGAHGLAADIKDQVEEQGRRCLLIAGDISDDEADEHFSQQAVQQIIETFGRLDVFINFSAHAFAVDALFQPEREQPQAVRSQVFPQFNMMKAALNQMLD